MYIYFFFTGIFILGAKRTAYGTFGGTFKNTTGTQLQTHACKATLEAAGVRPDQVDSVVIGNVLVVRNHKHLTFHLGSTEMINNLFCFDFQSSQADGNFLPRHTSLHCGIPIDRPALGVNRLCGSGFQAMINGAQDILVGAARISLTGGCESMSMSPFMVRNIRFGSALGADNRFEDSLWVNTMTNEIRFQ